MAVKADLDAIDWKILRELQDDGRITNVELSKRVGISAPPCLRRVKRLEESGIIRGYRAMLNSPALGLEVVAFCLIGLNHQSETELKAFAELTRGWPIVRAAWMVSGESDFLLHCVASDLTTLPDLRHRKADLVAECRHGAHGADHPPGQGRRHGGDRRGLTVSCDSVAGRICLRPVPRPQPS